MRRGLVVAALAATVLSAAPAPAAQARPTRPVVMVVLDELPLHSLLDRRGRIDAVRYPNFAALARTSTWYSSATTVSDASKVAIPSILTGSTPHRGQPADVRGHPHNLFTLLRRQGYRLRVEEEATSLCPYENCRRRFGAREFLARDRLERFRAFTASLSSSAEPTLYFKHTLLPHVPWIFTPSTRRYDQTVIGPIRGLNSSEISVFDRTLVRQSWQRHLLQVGAVDSLIGELLRSMEATGLLDRAVLVVVADHGVSFRVGATDRRTIVPGNAQDIASIPLFIHRPGQRRGRIDRSLIHTSDILPTVARQIGLRLPRGVSGRAAGSRALRSRSQVTVLSRAPIRRIDIGRRRLGTLKRRALRNKLRLFGSGRRSLFDFGPNRSLLSRPVGRLRIRGRGRLRGTLNGARLYDNVNTAAEFVPAHVTGQIAGGRGRSRRDVAVAVNGTIRAVSRSVRLRGRRKEHFSFLVNENVLVDGPNNIEVFTVARRRGRYRLRRIYGRPFVAASR